MQIRHAISPQETASLNSQGLRDHFLIENVCAPASLHLVYSHYDRVIIGGVSPLEKGVVLPNYDALKSDYFLERREMGVINVGGEGSITVDDQTFDLPRLSCLYIGRGTKNVEWRSKNSAEPAHFFLLSASAHAVYPTKLMLKEAATPVTMGATETANNRTIYKYIHADGLASCQLVMGLTILHPGNVWNTMPPHVHDRRMEAYFYFDIPDNQRVLHLMGEPQETRNLWVANHQVVISPPWSIHAGCGTHNYGFIWGMAGENQQFTDMDFQPVEVLR